MGKIIKFCTFVSLLLLAASALYGRFQQTALLARCSPSGEFVNVGDQRIHYIERPGGEIPVVFLHGASSNAREWVNSLFHVIPENYRLFAIDRPGLGFSSRGPSTTLVDQTRIIKEAITALELDRPILVVHSLSGALGARMVSESDNFRGLIIIAGATYPIGSGSAWYTHLATMPVIGPVFRYAVVPALAPQLAPEMVKASFSPQPVPENYMSQACTELLFNPDRFLANAEDLNQIRPFLDESYPLYSGITLPVSLIYGDQDDIVYKFTHSAGFRYKVDHARVHMLQDVGHLPHYANAQLIVDELELIAGKNQQGKKNNLDQ